LTGARGAVRVPWWRDNSLTLVFGVLLLGALAGQALSGAGAYNQSARTAGYAEVGVLEYLASSQFAVDVAENWQSEFLQFTLYIVLTVWLVQCGSAESKQLRDAGRGEDQVQLVGVAARPDSPRWARAGGWRTRVYSHSLSVAMGAVFLASWIVQALTGCVAANEERMRDRLDPVSLWEYLCQPDFWNRTLQNWQSELLAIGTMAAFTIYLRERGSPESKPVGAPHAWTGSQS